MANSLYMVESILAKALDGKELARTEIKTLVNAKKEEAISKTIETARLIRKEHFGNKVFIYGFVYLSTFCRNYCAFCYHNKSNRHSKRYRLSPSEVLQYSKQLKCMGVHLVDLTMGEDPQILSKNCRSLIQLVKIVKDEIGLPIMVSPGVVGNEVLKRLKNAGTDWYALYQETYNRRLFSILRSRQDFDEREHAKISARESGLLVEDGILVGVGENCEDRAESLLSMRKIGAEQVRAMGFVPQTGTRMESQSGPPLLDELKMIAILRITCQDRLIPASLDIDGAKGLQLRLMAGANVITSIIPDDSSLVGVADPKHLFRMREVEYIKEHLNEIGLQIASKRKYEDCINIFKTQGVK
jgi:methylornithine synthase